MKGSLVKYKGKGTGYRTGRGYRPRNPYIPRAYSPNRASRYRARNPYSRSPYRLRIGPRYGSHSRIKSEPNARLYSPPEPRYEPRSENRASSEVGPRKGLLGREEFFEHHPPNFPEHWNEDFRKEVMDKAYDRYVESAIFKALAEKVEAEENQGMKKEESEKPEERGLEDFERDPQDKLLDVIQEKKADSPEGKAAYDELLNVQLREINKLEDEYSKERDKLEAENSEKNQIPELASESNLEGKPELELQGQNRSEVEELSQAEMEQAMDHLESDLFSEPEVELSEIEKAEAVEEDMSQMDQAEIEVLVSEALEETMLESSEIESEIGSEVEDEGEEAEVS